MELLIKVGNKYLPDDPNFEKGLRDGHVIGQAADGYYKGKTERRHHCVLTVPGDYWKIRGSTDLKADTNKTRDLHKYLIPVKSNGKYPWESSFGERPRAQDWYVDFKELLDLGLISQSLFEAIYDKKIDPGRIFIDRTFTDLLKHEDESPRKISKFSFNLGSVASGTYEIGSGADYSDLPSFINDIADPLTGDLTAEHRNEETAFTSDPAIATETGSNLLKITAVSGAEHNGGAYGNGARINFSSWQEYGIYLYEATDGDLANIEISKLAVDMGGSSNRGIYIVDIATGADLLISRMLMKGDGNCFNPIIRSYGCPGDLTIINSIVYGATNEEGINDASGQSGATSFICNNAVCKCDEGIQHYSSTPAHTAKNNLCQGNTTADYTDPSNIDTHSKNVSEDTTSPDASYQSLNCHDGNSCFVDYPNDDYRLTTGGDELDTLDDGDDLSGTFTDDIVGTTRSTWYIGAFELVSGQTYQAEAADGLSMGDSPAGIATFQAAIADGLKGGDAPGKVAQLLAESTDGTVMGDVGAALAVFLAGLTDGINSGDAPGRTIRRPGAATDGIAAGDSPGSRATFQGGASDGAILGDTGAAIATFLLSAADGADLGDTPARTISKPGAISDGITAGDTSGVTAIFQGVAIDGLTVGEALAVAALYHVLATDGAKFGDSLVASILGAAIQALAVDGLAAGDSPSVAGTFLKAVTDGLDLGETVSALLTAIGEAADGVTLGDMGSRTGVFRRSATDGAAFGEGLAAALTALVQAADGIVAGDTAAGRATFQVAASDAAAFGSVVSRIMAFAAVVTDGFTIGDVAAHFQAAGELTITITGKAASVTFTVSAPGASFSGKRPEVSFDVS